MLEFNRNILRDKIHACWIGKNIGGTMGMPYEETHEINDIKGFVTDEGVIIPNDDLDLQLIWLKAMEELGPKGVNEQVLAEYWLTYIKPHWKEYGVGKSNMCEGFLPPLSGEVNNDLWRNSNGAWIRTEIWASLYPGCPDKAIEYAFYDASVDHGFGEGTFAAIFVAAMESAAFIMSDIRELLKLGLSKIPESCRISRSVRLVIDAYDSGKDWKTARQILVEDSTDLGWFQAPANVGFAVIGLLYGEGDFKNSMIITINCGDDTDCTAATVGSLLGIAYGTKIIPADWSKHIGDQIVQMCLLPGHGKYPDSCTQLTDCIMNLHAQTMYSPFYNVNESSCVNSIVHDEAEDFSDWNVTDHYGSQFVDEFLKCSCYSYKASCVFFEVLVELDNEPRVLPLGTITGRITVRNKLMPEQKHYHLRWILPSEWSVSGYRNLHAHTIGEDPKQTCTKPFTIIAGETVEAMNRLVLEVVCNGRPSYVYVPVQIMG